MFKHVDSDCKISSLFPEACIIVCMFSRCLQEYPNTGSTLAQQACHVPSIAYSLRSDIDIFHHLKHFKHFKHVKHVKCNYLQQWHKYLYFSGVWNSHGETGMKQFQLLVFGGKWKKHPQRLCSHFHSTSADVLLYRLDLRGVLMYNQGNDTCWIWSVLLCGSKWLRHGMASEMFNTSVSDSLHSFVWIEDFFRAWPTILEPLQSQYGEVVWPYCLGLGISWFSPMPSSQLVRIRGAFGLLGNHKRTLLAYF